MNCITLAVCNNVNRVLLFFGLLKLLVYLKFEICLLFDCCIVHEFAASVFPSPTFPWLVACLDLLGMDNVARGFEGVLICLLYLFMVKNRQMVGFCWNACA